MSGIGIEEIQLSMDFWSAFQEEVAVSNVAGNVALPNVVVALPAGAVPTKAIAFLKARMVENTNVAANKLSGAQNIQIRKNGAGSYVTALSLVDDLFTLAASTREAFDVMMGNNDIVAKVDGDGTYNFQWTLAVADVANLQLNDVQTGLRVWFRL